MFSFVRRLRHKLRHRNDVFVTALEYRAWMKAVMELDAKCVSASAGSLSAGWYHKDSAPARFAVAKREIDKRRRLP